MDGTAADYAWARDNLPNSLLVARDHPLSEQHADMLKDPVGTGKRHAQEWNAHQQRLGFDKAKTLILGINEPKVWDAGVPEALRKYTIALCDEATVYGLRVGAMQLSVGWPANKGGDTGPDWSPYHGVDNAIRHNHGALVVHEYWADDGPLENWGWWCGRVLKCPWQVPIIIGETGIDMYVKDASIHHAHRGWLGRMAPEQYARELAGYVSRMKDDSRYVGCAVFASDYVDDAWKSFDLERAYSAVLATPIPDVGPGPTPPDPTPPVTPPTPVPDEIDWDARLTARGCTLQPALVPSDPAPLVRVGRWFNEEEAQGRVNVFVRLLDENGNLATDVPVTWFWADGSETKRTERKSDPWLQSKGLPAEYSLDFSMYTTAPAYGIRIEGYSGDVIDGCGLGSIEQPDWNIHTSYYFEWKLSQVPEIILPPIDPPIPPFPPTGEIEAGIVIAPAGLNLRAGPSTDTAVLGTLRVGSTVLHDDEQDGWLHVIDGWVSGDYVGDAAATILSPTLPAPPGQLIWPVRNGRVTNWFGSREIDYSQWGLESHDGIDIGARSGEPVLCVADGVVKATGNDASGFGLYVRVWHPAHGFHSLYAHLSEIDVQDGQPAGQGDTLGAVGSTGNSSGPHLHMSFRVGSEEDYYRVHTGHKQGASDPMAIYAVINKSDPNLLI
jgi:hypothetical protein